MHCKKPAGQVRTDNKQTNVSQSQQAESVQPIDLSQVPKASASKTAYLNTGIWHCLAATKPGADDYQKNFRVTDLQFNTDGTVQISQNNQILASGRWAFEDSQNIIYVSSTLAELNSSWKVLDKGFRMVWLGNTNLNNSGVQMRWDCYKD
jgi:hypothetical protein